MDNDKTWISPDGKITKVIIVPGQVGLKPTENCECIVKIAAPTCHLDVKAFNDSPVKIGQIDTGFGRSLEKCLLMMNAGEIANVTFETTSCIVELKSFISNGYIYEWDAQKKYSLALEHKNKGVVLFRTNYVDASHQFSKSIKLLASIPIPIDNPPDYLDGLSLMDVRILKTNLYNNLASCYLKHREYDIVIDLCNRVLADDRNNLKALYKLGVAYNEVHNYEGAYEMLKRLLSLDPSNKAAIERLKSVAVNVNEANAKVNAMVKKMFS